MSPLTADPVPRFTGGEGFSINFLRREVVSLRIRRAVVYAAAGYLVVNALVMIRFLWIALLLAGQGWQLQAELHNKRPAVTASKALRQEMETLETQAVKNLGRLNAIIALQEQRFLVSDKLAALAKTLPDRTWITGLAGSRDHRVITIQASYLIDPEASHDLPVKGWVNALRADPHFGRGLKRLDVGSSSRKEQGNAERFDFELTAEWQANGRH